MLWSARDATVACAPLSVGERAVGALLARSDARETGRDERRGDLRADDLDRLLALAGPLALAVRNARQIQVIRAQRERLGRENRHLREALSVPRDAPLLVGRCEALEKLRATVRQVAPSDLPVLLTGETGTGKDLVARLVHAWSRRRDGPYVPCNVATLPASLVEAELFGTARGAYTGASQARQGLFEAAHGGTLFLDEIAELPPPAQAVLLRTLQDGELRRVGETRARRVDVRIVAATNRDLDAAVSAGEFRRDLLFRINAVRLELPALRDRPEDVPLLVEHLLPRVAARQQRDVPSLQAETLRRLVAFDWPGNVRELENELARALALTPSGGSLRPERLSAELHPPSARDPAPPSATVVDRPLPQALRDFERQYVAAALAAHDGNRTRAAGTLGVTRPGLHKIMRRHELR